MDLSFTSSVVQERMMRVGIEARGITDPMEVYEIAVKTLKNDKSGRLTNISMDMQKLFTPQIEKFGGLFYFLLEDQGKLQVIRTANLVELEGKYEGQLYRHSSMPKLRRIS